MGSYASKTCTLTPKVLPHLDAYLHHDYIVKLA